MQIFSNLITSNIILFLQEIHEYKASLNVRTDSFQDFIEDCKRDESADTETWEGKETLHDRILLEYEAHLDESKIYHLIVISDKVVLSAQLGLSHCELVL